MTTKPDPAASERARMAAVMALPDARAFAHLAGTLAVSTDLTPTQISAALAAASGRDRTYAHLDTPQARAGLQQWQQTRQQREAEQNATGILAAGGTGARR